MLFKKLIIIFSIVSVLLLFSCVDGVYDPEERWRLNSLEADNCEDNDSFETACEPASALDLLYLNFYDDFFDYFIIDFDTDLTYTIETDVPFDHLTDTVIMVYDAGFTALAGSTDAADDERDAVISGFVPAASRLYVVVSNSSLAGTGELRGYSLLITGE